jgi:hypothetical protein
MVDRLAVLFGVSLIVFGASMWSHPAAIILAGLFLLAGGIWRARV